jgi:hypothetical protein
MKNTDILGRNCMKNSDGVIHIASCDNSYKLVSSWSQGDFFRIPPEQSSYLQIPIEPQPWLAITNISSIPQTVFLYFIKAHIYAKDGQELKTFYTGGRNTSGILPSRKHFKILQPSQTFKTRLLKESILLLPRPWMTGYNDKNPEPFHLILKDYCGETLSYNLSVESGNGNRCSVKRYRFWLSFELWCDDEEWCSDAFQYKPITSSCWDHVSSIPHAFIKTWTGHLLTKPVELTLSFSGYF